MTEAQILLVKKSWSLLRNVDPFLVGDLFYTKLFIDAPQLKNLFHTSRKEQSKKLIDMLSMVVGRLDNLDELTDDIRQLAIRHVKYGAKERHYKDVGKALLWTLQQGLGKDWNDDVKEAWTACYQILSSTMINASGYNKSKSEL